MADQYTKFPGDTRNNITRARDERKFSGYAMTPDGQRLDVQDPQYRTKMDAAIAKARKPATRLGMPKRGM